MGGGGTSGGAKAVSTFGRVSIRNGEKRRWAVAVATAAGVGALVLWLLRGPIGVGGGPAAQTVGAVGKAKAPLQIARPSKSDLELKEEAFIRDLRPLFLPTALNAVPPEPRMAEGRTSIELELSRAPGSDLEFSFLRELPPTATLDELPADKATARDWVSADVPGPVLAGLGRGEAKVEPTQPRGGFIEIRSAVSGEAIWSEPIPASARPPSDKAWQPLELLAAVEAAGLVAPPVITEGSRVDEVDVHFRRYVAQIFRVGDRLPPGFYRIVIGP